MYQPQVGSDSHFALVCHLVHFGLVRRPKLEPEADDLQHLFQGRDWDQRKVLYCNDKAMGAECQFR